MNEIINIGSRSIKITRLSKASWFKLEIDNKIIHIDPGYTGYFKNQNIPVEELDDKADLILISHFHKDHLQPEAIEKIFKDGTTIVAPQSCKGRIEHDWIPVSPGDSKNYDGIKIVVVNAYNTEQGHSTRKVHHRGVFVGYLLYVGDMSLYFAGDTDLIPEMRGLGQVDVAFLPIGGTFVMDIEEAVEAVCIINPKVVLPMHQSKMNPEVFKKAVSAKSVTRVIILDIGNQAYE